jgi:hypothetical protein
MPDIESGRVRIFPLFVLLLGLSGCSSNESGSKTQSELKGERSRQFLGQELLRTKTGQVRQVT